MPTDQLFPSPLLFQLPAVTELVVVPEDVPHSGFSYKWTHLACFLAHPCCSKGQSVTTFSG